MRIDAGLAHETRPALRIFGPRWYFWTMGEIGFDLSRDLRPAAQLLELGELVDDLLQRLVDGAQGRLIAPIGRLIVSLDCLERILKRLHFRRRSSCRCIALPVLHEAVGHATGSVLGHHARPIAALLHALIELVDRLFEGRDMPELLLRRGETTVEPGKFTLYAGPDLCGMVLAHRQRNLVVELEDALLELGNLIADMIAAALLQPFANFGQALVEISERAQVRPLRNARRKLLDHDAQRSQIMLGRRSGLQ